MIIYIVTVDDIVVYLLQLYTAWAFRNGTKKDNIQSLPSYLHLEIIDYPVFQ